MNIKYYRDPIEYERKKGWSPSDLSFERAVSEAMKVLLSRGDVLGFRHSSCSFWHVFVNAWNRVSPDLLVSNFFRALRFPTYLIHLGASSDLIITTRSTLFRPAFLHVRKLPTRPAHDKYLARKPNFHIPERRVWVNEGRPKGVPQSGKAKITYSTEVGFTAEYSYESAEPGWLEESNSVAQVFHGPFTCSRQGQVFLFR